MHLNPEMTNEKAAMLLRCAMIEDATTVNERLAAITAEISVDDDTADIMVDDDLWPDLKETPKTDKMAELLWLELEWASSVGTFPFAWPGIGEHSKTVVEYYQDVMAAYSSQKPKG